MNAAEAIAELRTLKDRVADDATGDLVFRRHVNLVLAEVEGEP